MIARTIIAAAILLLPATASAQVVWNGGFETGDLSEYDLLLNPTINNVDYTTVVQDVVSAGQNAARIELHDDAVWSNGLRRVELKHRPASGRTREGATTYFAWSFYLPEQLPSDPSQQIGYWESRNSWQQMMAFTLRGSDLSFVTRQPNNVVHWDGAGVATPGQWHRIAMRVLWSTDAAVGSVSVWFDGAEVVSDGAAKTLNDGNEHFVQFGLLRGDADFADVPVIYLDDAVEGDSLADVRPDGSTSTMEPPAQDMGASMPDAGGAPDSGRPTDMSIAADGGATQGVLDTGDGRNDAAGGSPSRADTSESGCCAQVGAPRRGQLALWVLALLFVVRRKRSDSPR